MSGPWTSRAVFAVVSLVMGSSGAGAAGPIAPPPIQGLEVTVTSSNVSLMARETPLADVLRAIGQQAGVKIVLHSDFNTPVTATLANVPLDEAIRRLSRWHSVVLIYDSSARGPDDAVLREVWVTSAPADRRGAGPGTNRGTSPGATQSEAGRRQGRDLPVTDDRQQVSPVSNPQLATTLKPSPASNPSSRVIDSQLAMALKRGASDNGTGLIDALVRERGVEGAVNILRETATRDPNQGVRRGAIRVLASWGSSDAVEAIRAMLLDALPDVRSEAHTALRRLGQAR